ncbi:MAG TPA: sulfatase-like hydrolase/transferase [Anaerolineales bacterium]|nr:sulfatase-like hydrolase/transferase [Anaerolineales bacterium]
MTDKNKTFNRRDFLKLAGAATLGAAAPKLPAIRTLPTRQAGPGLLNVLIIVFDAFSARHISLYGYDRETTPNIARLAERANVYHNHYAGGNFTFPGTSTLLTGTYPWTHRGFNPEVGVDPFFEDRNLFAAFDQYYCISYTHNQVAYTLLDQIQNSMDRLKPRQDLYLDRDFISSTLFANDEDTAGVSWWQSVVKKGRKSTYSLFFSHIYRMYKERTLEKYQDVYPRGLPNIRDDNYFLPEDATDFTFNEVPNLPQPFLGYFHYLPPHDPYLTRVDYVDAFHNDGFDPIKKPEHLFSRGRTPAEMAENRRWYDEYILLVDAEFGRMFDELEKSGVLENTILVLTSDHGEQFERGLERHYFEVLHQPVIQVPLMIFMPGQTIRQDVHAPTSAVDLLPTLLHLTGQPAPDWGEGQILYPFRGAIPDTSRAVYAVEAKESAQYGPIDPVSLMIVKDGYKLTYYSGWERQQGKQDPLVELFHIDEDKEELEDLSDALPEVRDALLDEVLEKAKS